MSQPESAEQAVYGQWNAWDWQDRTVVVAVSGGADSVGLLRLFHAMPASQPRQLVVAHFNHRLRDEAADDAAFVERLAGELGLPFELGDADVARRARSKGDGVEAAARQARYEFLAQAADRHRASFVATAHTADDQAETILHRILRGTGIAGLRGIREARRLFGRQDLYLVRPLLMVRRELLLRYLKEIGQPYREDATNRDLRFTRNRIRHRLLPLLQREFNPGVIEALVRLGDTAAGAQSAIDELVDDLLHEAVIEIDEEQSLVRVNCQSLAGINHHLVREMFVSLWREMGWPEQNMGLVEWDELADEALGGELHEDGSPVVRTTRYKRVFPGRIVAERRGGEMTFRQEA